jgi:DNA polymerase
MNLLIYDCETLYDNEYSLRKMTTPAYILDPRFELQMVAVKLNDGPHEIIDGPDFPAYLAKLDPKQTTTVAFNALFDNSILAWRYGFVPAMMLDAMGMARALLGHELTSFSLKNVADHLDLGSKGTALLKTLGKRREQIMAEGLWDEFCAYAKQDNILCEGIFYRLLPQFPTSERRVMDLVLRCCIEPAFVCDVEMLRDHLVKVKQAKADLLNACSIDQIKLMSAPKFKQALEERGVVVEMKPGKKGPIPAFAKTDSFMEELSEHPDVEVQAMAAARLGVRSTLEESRAETFIEVASLPWETTGTLGNMPVPLGYGRAHTHRLGGEWNMNWQNLPADRKKDGKSKLRAAQKAPKGYKVVVADLGQIECRLSAWLCGCTTLLEEFRDKKDPYSLLASEIFGRPINRKLPGDTAEGFIGKTGILGLGYGAGKDKFDTMVQQQARTFEIDLTGKYTREIGDRGVDAYRRRYHQMPAGWRKLDNILRTAWLNGNTQTFGPGGVITISKGKVIGPNGLELRYAEPRLDYETNELWYRYGRFTHKIYGAKFLENIIQFLARIVVFNAALRLAKHGLNFRLQAHDELVFILREEIVDDSARLIHREFVRSPSWASDLPLTADVGVGDSYGEAK